MQQPSSKNGHWKNTVFSITPSMTSGKEIHIVLTERSNKTLEWNLPGGKIENNEDPSTALVRETLEETGLEVRTRIHLKPTHYKKDSRGNIKAEFFICKSFSNSAKITDSKVRIHKTFLLKKLFKLKEGELLENYPVSPLMLVGLELAKKHLVM